jgi:hypothetical protein
LQRARDCGTRLVTATGANQINQGKMHGP